MRRTRRMTGVLLGLWVLVLPLLLGQGCPTPAPGGDSGGGWQGGGGSSGNAVTLLNLAIDTTYPGAIEFGGFTPTAVGRRITVTISASDNRSRPSIAVYGETHRVAAEDWPMSSTTTVSFTSTTTAEHVIMWTELATTSSYTLTVTQDP